MKTVSIRVDNETYLKLKLASFNDGKTISQLLREAIDDLLEKYQLFEKCKYAELTDNGVWCSLIDKEIPLRECIICFNTKRKIQALNESLEQKRQLLKLLGQQINEVPEYQRNEYNYHITELKKEITRLENEINSLSKLVKSKEETK